MVPAFSTTKGMSTPAMAVTHSRGLFELDRPVALYWPDFARHEEAGVAVRQPLAHQAGLAVVETNEPEAGVTAGFDEVLRLDSAFTMAFMKPFPILSLGTSARAYVHTGMGGSFGFADVRPDRLAPVSTRISSVAHVAGWSSG